MTQQLRAVGAVPDKPAPTWYCTTACNSNSMWIWDPLTASVGTAHMWYTDTSKL